MKTRRQFLRTSLAASGSGLTLTQAETTGEWKSLFDGETLDGWRKVPRIYGAGALGKAHSQETVDAVVEKILSHHEEENTPAFQHLGDWKVVDGAIEGGKDPAGNLQGAYLITEEEAQGRTRFCLGW